MDLPKLSRHTNELAERMGGKCRTHLQPSAAGDSQFDAVSTQG